MVCDSANSKATPAGTHGDSKDGGHSVEVVWVFAHGQDFRDDSRPSPCNTEYLCQLFQVDGCRLPDREDSVSEP